MTDFDYRARLERFQAQIAAAADLAFLPISAELQYLTGIPREMPNFGAVRYPGRWLEGAWLAPGREPIVTLPRMTATFHGLGDLPYQLRVLGDHDDPAALVGDVLAGLAVPQRPRLALADSARAETVVALQALLPGAEFRSATALLTPLRRVKDEAEIAVMRQAGAITEQAFAAVIARLRHGMTELDIVSEVDLQLRRHGALGPSFTSAMYNSGPGHPLVLGHQEQRWDRPLEPPVALLFDFGAIFQGYCYDFGRTVAFGAPPAGFQRVHALIMASQAAGIAALRPGATGAQADAAARAVITEAGLGETFRHRLGHGIGLDVHEAPYLTAGDDTPLEEGMLFTVEPSITQFQDFSARVEDVVVVRPGGGERLTQGYQELMVVD